MGPWITQYETKENDYAHVYKKDGSYRENCMLQLQQLEEMEKAQPLLADDGAVIDAEIK